MTRDRIIFLLNNKAGKKNTNWESEISTWFETRAEKAYIYPLNDQFSKEEFKEFINKNNGNCIVAVGGDGTVTLAADIAASMNIPLGIVPAGSANGMARELEIPSKPEEVFTYLTQGKAEEIDAIVINDSFTCIHLADVGLNAHLIKYFDEGNVRGQLGYARVIIKTLWKKSRMMATMRGINNEIKRDALMIVLANAGKYGTGAVINPLSDLNDGLFEMVVVKKLSVRALLRMLFFPGMFNPKHVEVYKCKEVNIRAKSSMHFQVDGEYAGKVNSITAKIAPSYIQMILPVKQT